MANEQRRPPGRKSGAATNSPAQSLSSSHDETWAKAWQRCWDELPEVMIRNRIRRGERPIVELEVMTEEQVRAYSRGIFYSPKFDIALKVRSIRERHSGKAA